MKKIAVIDSGINLEYKDFLNMDIECVNMYDLGTNVVDKNGHGTSSVGEIIKMNRSASILVIKALDEKAQSSLGLLIKALRYCLTRDDIDIINLSLSCRINDTEVIDYFESVINQINAKGITIVCSIANTYGKENNDYGYPAKFSGIIKVRHLYSATCYIEYNQEHDEYIYYGTYNLMPWRDTEYRFYRVNSSAAPKIAGIISKGTSNNIKSMLMVYNNKNELFELENGNQELRNVISSYCFEKGNLGDYIEIQSKNCTDLLRRIEHEFNIVLDYMDFTVEDFISVERLASKCSRYIKLY